MPRKKLIKTSDYFYHVTTRSNHKEWFKIPLKEVWKISIQAFQIAQRHSPAIISQYVLMSNHYHMLIRTPHSNIDEFMYYFNKSFSEKLRKKSGYKNRMFGSNYRWSLITNQKYFDNTFRYIYQNPLRAGLVSSCEDYPYSTLYYSSQGKQLPFPFQKLSQLEDSLDYINTRVSYENDQNMRKLFKKSIIK